MTAIDAFPSVRLVLTVEEAAERLCIGRTTMYALIADGEVESVRIGRLRRVPADALDEYVLRLRGLLDEDRPGVGLPGQRPRLVVVRPGHDG